MPTSRYLNQWSFPQSAANGFAIGRGHELGVMELSTLVLDLPLFPDLAGQMSDVGGNGTVPAEPKSPYDGQDHLLPKRQSLRFGLARIVILEAFTPDGPDLCIGSLDLKIKALRSTT